MELNGDDKMTLSLSSSETVIHYEPTPSGVCLGKDTAVLELEAYLKNPPDEPVIYSTMLACFSGNVDCKRCKAYLKANKERRKRMLKQR